MKLRPALVSVDKERVKALELTEVDGMLAVPIDKGHRYIGDVFQERIHQDGLSVKRWFATTLVASTLGPFTQKPLAVAALVEWNHLRVASVEETTTPLF